MADQDRQRGRGRRGVPGMDVGPGFDGGRDGGPPGGRGGGPGGGGGLPGGGAPPGGGDGGDDGVIIGRGTKIPPSGDQPPPGSVPGDVNPSPRGEKIPELPLPPIPPPPPAAIPPTPALAPTSPAQPAGTFAQPGTAGAAPFSSQGFGRVFSRPAAGGSGGPPRFGPGSPFAGDGGLGSPEDDDMLMAILDQIRTSGGG